MKAHCRRALLGPTSNELPTRLAWVTECFPEGAEEIWMSSEVRSRAPTTMLPLTADAVTASEPTWKTQRRRSTTTRPEAGITRPWKAGGEVTLVPFETLTSTTAGVASGSKRASVSLELPAVLPAGR